MWFRKHSYWHHTAMPFCMTRSNDLVEASAYKENTACKCSMCREGFRHHRCNVPTKMMWDKTQDVCILSRKHWMRTVSQWNFIISLGSTNHWPQQITLKHGVLKQTRSRIARACNTSLPCWIVIIFGHCVSHFADNVLQTFLWQVNFLRHMAYLSHMQQKIIACQRQVSRISSENLTSQDITFKRIPAPCMPASDGQGLLRSQQGKSPWIRSLSPERTSISRQKSNLSQLLVQAQYGQHMVMPCHGMSWQHAVNSI